ncbi:hypothetical protein A3C98_04485 [Candidatus Roizmanbacteria bacterium RIFCSPHIGHO2_02_FULL_37_15]|uniref:Glycosyltransferase 2-like domain-containing protein n=1 Tax=Candidatus Roizmanbacteria bacterium RIFCSPLOWO2_01_FULL_37_16 TaxID=1802058 RepID=A0A1F7IQU5_9BACT|nr:MAG: hypothetical protein A3C98_04485 [Candidatus Roizmanbacteria bacterium RIFCSPHIGHO2_02_FULL_37_15]OGK33036.1 MAG: hypothetical protein A3F57_06590 [Candidatus Roizmanbacteria bacterium RIFCSPHIGHO2_12_FULL_36_11]OGK45743.1 MAG: hypothetical protein A3B40_05845 [Candidatus Roizmanbacteria bacterium RIFCSPLOWO2_01_FULL_37_16]OGK56076.1 MAG: hypothetical protein A3I50_01925 [Candidatus Roizmanbacteria bacterium RIFCSPLOWO2_02_FULL_37_9]
MKVTLSVIVLSYNTKELTLRCISSLIKTLSIKNNFISEIILVDNGSTDGSVDQFKNLKLKNTNDTLKVKTRFNKKNLGYAKGNNQGLRLATGKYVLFLNSDTIVDKIDFRKLFNYLENNPRVGVLTVKVILPNSNIDPASHRGFPTIWNSFCYITGLEDVFKNIPIFNKIFTGYHLSYQDYQTIHEIDSPSGAFYLTKKYIVKKLDGFDENFFMYGEDLDLSFRIKKLGYKVIYYPEFVVTHIKHASGLEKNESSTRKKTRHYFFNSMEIFYKKHYEANNSWLMNKIVYKCIEFLKQFSMSF